MGRLVEVKASLRPAAYTEDAGPLPSSCQLQDGAAQEGRGAMRVGLRRGWSLGILGLLPAPPGAHECAAFASAPFGREPH